MIYYNINKSLINNRYYSIVLRSEVTRKSYFHTCAETISYDIGKDFTKTFVKGNQDDTHTHRCVTINLNTVNLLTYLLITPN